MLRTSCWGLVCEANDIVYNDLVRQFYVILRMVEDHTESNVNNTLFSFDFKINEIFGMPNEGDEF